MYRKSIYPCLLFILTWSVVPIQSLLAQDQWPRWRGPSMNAVAEGQNPPTEWSADKVIWKTEVPGRGNSSPVVVGDKIFITTAYEDSQRQTVLAYRRSDGTRLWETEINRGGFAARIYKPNNTYASPTIASDGEFVFATFPNNDSVQLAKLDMDGNVLWKKKAGVFLPKQYQFGYGASPLVVDSLVVVSSECEEDGTLKAFKTGRRLRGLVGQAGPGDQLFEPYSGPGWRSPIAGHCRWPGSSGIQFGRREKSLERSRTMGGGLWDLRVGRGKRNRVCQRWIPQRADDCCGCGDWQGIVDQPGKVLRAVHGIF